MKYLLLALALTVTAASYSQPLKRRVWLNAGMDNVSDSLVKVWNLPSGAGALITLVKEGGTAGLIKLQKDDIIVAVNGKTTSSPAEVKAALALLRENDPITVDVIRKGKKKSLKGTVVPMARETNDKCDVLYDRAPYGSGFLSTITLKPKTAGKHPAILFIPGYMCYSLDNLGKHPYAQIVNRLAEKGFVVMRVDKPGEGDCMNCPDCRSIGLYEEIDAFREGLQKLKSYDFVDTSNIFIFGHSLGAMEAPLVAYGFNVKGIIIEGTSNDTWLEYILDMFRFQNPIAGVDYAENETMIIQSLPMLYDYLVLKKTPAELAANTAYESILTGMMQYDGSEKIWDRHYTYWQELQDMNQAQAWKNTGAHVLVMRGSGDLEAFSTDGHKAIAEMVNYYRPGFGTFVLLENSDHAFCKSNTPAESFKNGQTPGYHYENFNDNVIEVVVQWMQKVMLEK